jgi:hypothetical protein
MPSHHVDELRIALGGPHGSEVSNEPDDGADKPKPTAAASVPLTMATERGAPPRRIGSVSARWTGA